MRNSLKQEMRQASAQQFAGNDVYQFILQHTFDDAELSLELGFTLKEIESLKQRVHRG